MKYFLLIILFLISFKAKALPFEYGFTYTVLDTHVLKNYWDVSCINDNDCIFLSRKGVSGAIIQRTKDGGKTREIIFLDTATMKDGSIDYNPDYMARHIFYFESGLIIVVGYSGGFLKSTDFGETWKKYKSETDFEIMEVDLVDENLAFIANDLNYKADGKVHYSTDGCETWNLFPVPDSISKSWCPSSLSIQINGDLLIGFYSITDIDNWVMYKTNFDGSKWELMNTPPNTYKIHYMNDNEWVARCAILNDINKFQYVTAYKTFNAGKTWELKFKSELPHSSAKFLCFQKHLILVISLDLII